MYVLYIPCWLLLQLVNTKESTYYLLDFQNIFSNSIHPLPFKSKTIHALFHFLLLIIVFKAITTTLYTPLDIQVEFIISTCWFVIPPHTPKRPKLVILCILIVILPSFGLGNRSTLETCTTGRYCSAWNFTIKSKNLHVWRILLYVWTTCPGRE